MKIAVFSTKSYDKEYMEVANKQFGHEIVYYEASLNEKTIKLAEGFEAVCVFVNDKLDANIVQALAKLGIKLIALRCAGFNNVDVLSAANNGMRILRVPAYSPHAVAEHAVALILTLNRKTHKAYNRIREGNFSLERLLGFDLYGRTVGVVGTGKIGSAFCQIVKGFGCKILATDTWQNPALLQIGVEYVELDTLLSESDIISLHCPLTPETHHIINETSLKKMKKNAMLINTSRGKLIDTLSVIDALKDGHLGYLGIDVYEQEEKLFFKDLSEIIIRDDKISRLMTFPNVLITAHQAFFTETAITQIANTTLQNVTDFCNNTIKNEFEVTQQMVK